MNIQAISAVYKKMLKEFIRFRIRIFFTVVFPLFFIMIFGIGFSSNNSAISTFSVGIVNDEMPLAGNISFANNFTGLLKNVKYDDTNKPVFNIKIYDRKDDLDNAIKDQSISIGLVLPENFSFTLLSAQNQSHFLITGYYLRFKDLGIDQSVIPPQFLHLYTATYNCTVNFIGDTQTTAFQVAKPIILTILQSYVDSFGNIPYAGDISFVTLTINSKSQSIFDTIVPGVFVFSLILQLGVLGSLLTVEYEGKTLNRIITSPIDPLSFLIAITLYQLTVSTIQFPFLLIGAYFFGFSSSGNFFLVYLLILLITFSIIGFAFIVGATIKRPEIAGMLGGLISAPLAFISGAFIPVPQIIIIKNIFPVSTGGTRDFYLYDFLPTSYAVKALNGVLLHNYGLQEILVEVIAIILLSSMLFLVGVLFFTKQRLLRASS